MGLIYARDRDFDPLFIAAGKKYGVDPALLKGIASVESGFHPDSIRWEPSGSETTQRPGDTDASRGLMQIIHAEAASLGWPKDRPDQDQFDPATSIDWGAKAIARYLEDPYWHHADDRAKFVARSADDRPNVEKAVAAYNMGYPRSIRYTTPFIAKIYEYPISYKTSPPADWHFGNQPYVSLVLSHAAAYRAELGGNKALAQSRASAIKKKVRGWDSVLASWSEWWWSSAGSSTGPGPQLASQEAPMPSANLPGHGPAAAGGGSRILAGFAAAAASVVKGCGA